MRPEVSYLSNILHWAICLINEKLHVTVEIMLVRTISRNVARASGLHGLWAVRFGSSIAQVRDPSYARVEEEDISFFRGVLGDTGVVTDSTALQALNQYVLPCYS